MRYYSGLQAAVFIENIYLSDIESIAFDVQREVVPIYGYSSMFPDDLVNGREIAMGEFVINFVRAGYLYSAAARHVKNTESNKEKQDILTTIKDKLSTNNITEAALDIFSSLGESTGDTEQSFEEMVWSEHPKKTPMPQQKYNYMIIFWDISRYDENSERYTEYRLHDVALTRSHIETDPSGMPVRESYSFIAKRIT